MLIGPSGVGKTLLAVATGRRAVEAGYRLRRHQERLDALRAGHQATPAGR